MSKSRITILPANSLCILDAHYFGALVVILEVNISTTVAIEAVPSRVPPKVGEHMDVEAPGRYELTGIINAAQPPHAVLPRLIGDSCKAAAFTNTLGIFDLHFLRKRIVAIEVYIRTAVAIEA